VVLGGNPQRLLAVLRDKHPVSAALKDPAGHLAHGLLVLDQKHRLPAGRASGLRRMAPADQRKRAGIDERRQEHRDQSALTRLGVELDVAAGLSHDAVHGGQSQPGPLALGLGGEERLEGAGDHLRGHARAGVDDPQAHVGARRRRGQLGRVLVLNGDVGGVDLQHSPGRHRVSCVDRQVDQNLLHLTLVGQYRPESLVKGDGEQDVRADRPAQQGLHVAHHVVEVEQPWLDHLTAPEREQLVRQRDGALGGSLDLDHVLIDRRPLLLALVDRGLQLLRHKRGVIQDHREQIVEVVRHAARQLAQALQPLRLLDLVVQVSALGVPWPRHGRGHVPDSGHEQRRAGRLDRPEAHLERRAEQRRHQHMGRLTGQLGPRLAE
jgi:hypothetical protein